ncbi:transcriptional regulator, IclR family [Oscillibacter sp. PC13]|uniref:IclR family transcriptional regulator n=1 Tax=Oscillibacter sp. PC13 TaxID=1855299 RepID=UPI0008F1D264|nr:IclR family transcriptional regulator [Oscillibacter sp. PC13]SFP87900.1 transcriptional regulator, IclR family [Oscillibacter sp. PC13]
MPNERIGRPSNQSVTKILQLVEILAESKVPMRLQDIIGSVGMPQATCLRYLNALILEGYAYQDRDSGRYALTWGVCNLGEKVRAHQSLRSISSDLINELSIELGLGICLVIEHEMECVYVDCWYEPASMGVSLMRIGKQSPLHATSSGKILLTEYTDAALDRLIAEKGLAPFTDKTITTKRALVEELETVKRQGYALDNEECEEGMRCVAAPIYDFTGKVAAAISVFGSSERITDACIQEEILPTLQWVAQNISFRMGSTFAPQKREIPEN